MTGFEKVGIAFLGALMAIVLSTDNRGIVRFIKKPVTPRLAFTIFVLGGAVFALTLAISLLP